MKGFIGQLMRVWMVVPEGNIEVKVNPQVRRNAIRDYAVLTTFRQVRPMDPPCPVFAPNMDGGFVLPSSGIWVMRFPYIYKSDKKTYLCPSDPQLWNHCHVMKNCITVREKVS